METYLITNLVDADSAVAPWVSIATPDGRFIKNVRGCVGRAKDGKRAVILPSPGTILQRTDCITCIVVEVGDCKAEITCKSGIMTRRKSRVRFSVFAADAISRAAQWQGRVHRTSPWQRGVVKVAEIGDRLTIAASELE